MWFRKEQLLTVTWAGDPTKPMVDNDPLELSPRRSFAAWSEIVRGTALPWSSSRAGAGARHRRRADRHHRAGQRGAAADRRAPAVAGARHRGRLEGAGGRGRRRRPRLLRQRAPSTAWPSAARRMPHARGDCRRCSRSPPWCAQMIGQVRAEQRAWRGEMALAAARPASRCRCRCAPSRCRRATAALLGFILIFNDLTDTQARRRGTPATWRPRCRAPAAARAAPDGRRRARRDHRQRQPGGDGHRRRRRRSRGGAAAGGGGSRHRACRAAVRAHPRLRHAAGLSRRRAGRSARFSPRPPVARRAGRGGAKALSASATMASVSRARAPTSSSAARKRSASAAHLRAASPKS